MALFSRRCGFGSKRDVPLSLALGRGGNAVRLWDMERAGELLMLGLGDGLGRLVL